MHCEQFRDSIGLLKSSRQRLCERTNNPGFRWSPRGRRLFWGSVRTTECWCFGGCQLRTAERSCGRSLSVQGVSETSKVFPDWLSSLVFGRLRLHGRNHVASPSDHVPVLPQTCWRPERRCRTHVLRLRTILARPAQQKGCQIAGDSMVIPLRTSKSCPQEQTSRAWWPRGTTSSGSPSQPLQRSY